MSCDDNVDPKLVSDLSITIDDGYTYWWLSPDIQLTDANGVLDQAIVGKDNLVDVRVHRNATGLLDSTTFINVELWVCDPSLVISPSQINSSRKLFDGVIDPTNLPASTNGWLSEVAKKVQSALYPPASPLSGQPLLVSQEAGKPPLKRKISWQPDNRDPVQQTGHKCLIARCFQDGVPGGQADDACFHAQKDIHVAQRNIAIVPVPMSPRRMVLNFPVLTNNTNAELSEAATIQVMADLNPDQKVLDILTPGLHQIPGYLRISRTIPTSFKLQLPDFPHVIVRDNTRLGCLGVILNWLSFKNPRFEPHYEADVQLQPRQVTQFTLNVDLAGSRSGDAHIFHLMHINQQQRVIGGLTVVAVVV